jgi:hypothetical protein
MRQNKKRETIETIEKIEKIEKMRKIKKANDISAPPVTLSPVILALLESHHPRFS